MSKTPIQLESRLSLFYSEFVRFMKIGKYPFPLTGNTDETAVFLIPGIISTIR